MTGQTACSRLCWTEGAECFSRHCSSRLRAIKCRCFRQYGNITKHHTSHTLPITHQQSTPTKPFAKHWTKEPQDPTNRPPTRHTTTHTTTTMADKDLKQIIQQLHTIKPSTLSQAPQLLSRAKLSLLRLNALIPSDSSSADHLALAREVLELGAFISIRQRDTDAFTRYFQQLQPFYALPAPTRSASRKQSNESKVTGLYLLLLLSQGDYAGFHTLLEGLESSEEGKEAVEKDEFVRYPVRLEQALMEGSYDKVWNEMKGERVPSEEFAIFSEVSWACFDLRDWIPTMV